MINAKDVEIENLKGESLETAPVNPSSEYKSTTTLFILYSNQVQLLVYS